MNAFLNIYMNAPTEGGTDGTAVSTGDMTAPLSFTLDATQNEVASDTIAVRCESGYQTSSDTVISVVSDTSNFWALSLDGANWSTSVTFTDTIVTTNHIFYVKASSSDSELPHNDTSVKLRVQTVIAAV